MRNDFSVVTIVKGRLKQLSNLISSIERSTLLPKELIVVWMAPPCSESLMTSEHFPIHHKFVANDPLPIAKAKNKGFKACSADNIVYIDVDCIISPGLFESLLHTLQPNRVVTARVRYLSTIPDHADFTRLRELSTEDSQSQWLPLNQNIQFTHFKSMLFAIKKQDYARMGGFDESFHGFGVVDVDFATQLETTGMQLFIVPDEALHQYHPTFDPPINHLFDIVSNASVYRQKWGQYPLEECLDKFAQEGFINADYHSAGLRVCRAPTQEEINAHLSNILR